MTAFEKFVFGLIALWFLAHAVRVWGAQAGIKPAVVSAVESLVTH